MSIKVAQCAASASAVVTDLRGRLGDPTVVAWFCSPKAAVGDVARAISDAYPNARTFGCTTAGEIVSGSMATGTIVAMGIDADTAARALVTIVPGIASSTDGIAAAFSAWERELGSTMLDLDPDRWVGIVLIDGLSGAEERVMDRIGDLTNLLFVGGSAGDDLAFARTLVAADRAVATNAAVLVLLECPNGFDLLKTQSFVPTATRLTPTRVDKAAREVIEFDGRPATVAYAAALGVPVELLAEEFTSHPLGLMVGGEPFVRSPQLVVGESVRFYCGVDEGMPLTVLASGSIVEQTRADLAAALDRDGPVAGILNFNCILRTLELESTEQSCAYGELFADVPTVGFSTYGEEYLGHINQTATMLLFR